MIELLGAEGASGRQNKLRIREGKLGVSRFWIGLHRRWDIDRHHSSIFNYNELF